MRLALPIRVEHFSVPAEGKSEVGKLLADRKSANMTNNILST